MFRPHAGEKEFMGKPMPWSPSSTAQSAKWGEKGAHWSYQSGQRVLQVTEERGERALGLGGVWEGFMEEEAPQLKLKERADLDTQKKDGELSQ